jgi:hypothetical protein
MRLFIVIAILGLAMVGVAVSTVLHTWFKYDAPREDERDDRD